ncbi:MAG: restriction endonuclease subunit S [Lentisphaeria bacterium]|nr:restriction endonuclease subunit S [Lentisphaeria bacterium]
MTPYPEYKATNLPWLPQIPAHWETRRAKALFRLVTEPAPENNTEELLSVYTHIGVRPRKDLEAKGNRASTTDGYWCVKKGDIICNKLLAWMGAIGVSEFEGVTSPAYDIFRKRTENIYPQYYHYLFRTPLFHSVFRAYSRGIMDMRLRLYYDQFGTIIIPYPNQAEQEQIVRYLDSMTAKINKLIRAKKKQIALLQEQKQATINQAVTKGLNPDAEMKDSGIDWLDQIPAHWEVKKAKYCVNINHGSDPVTAGDIPVYGSGAGSFKTCGEFKDGPAVLVGRKGATLHIPHYITGKYWNVDTAFDVKAKKNFFLHFYYFLATCFDYHFYISQTTLPSMTQTDYLNMKLPVPPQQEQYDIIQHLVMQDKKIDNLIAEIKNVINSLLEYKNSLIASVVTGQVDVHNIQVEDFDPADLITETDDDSAEDDDQPQEESEE